MSRVGRLLRAWGSLPPPRKSIGSRCGELPSNSISAFISGVIIFRTPSAARVPFSSLGHGKRDDNRNSSALAGRRTNRTSSAQQSHPFRNKHQSQAGLSAGFIHVETLSCIANLDPNSIPTFAQRDRHVFGR